MKWYNCPDDLAGCYCDEFGEYNVSDIVRITSDKNISEVPTGLLLHNLDYDSWDDQNNDPITPRDVLNNRNNYKRHWHRIDAADLQYPIVVMDDDIVDGLHRLCKAVLEDYEYILVVQITHAELDSININKKVFL